MYNRHIASSACSAIDSYDPEAGRTEHHLQQHIDLNTFLLYYVAEITYMDINHLISSLRHSDYMISDSGISVPLEAEPLLLILAVDYFERAPDVWGVEQSRLLASVINLNDALLRIVRLTLRTDDREALNRIRTKMHTIA